MALIGEIPLPYHGQITDETFQQIESLLGHRRKKTRRANLGTFSGYRIGLDIGNGNIGWCVLFEDGLRIRFLDAKAIREHNKTHRKGHIHLPDLASFVPLGTHKFENRDPETSRSLAGKRADARATRRRLKARQWRKFHVKEALREAGLLPRPGEPRKGHVDMRPGELRRRIVEEGSAFGAHPHDLGRALLNTLARRGWMPPVGRLGFAGESAFARKAEEKYRQALKDFGCRTVGVFLEQCAEDAQRAGEFFRRRHTTLAELKERDDKKTGKEDGPAKTDNQPSYERFKDLTPTLSLTLEECEILRKESALKITDEHWDRIKAAAKHRRPLKGVVPGVCEYLPDEPRCVAALPSFQQFRTRKAVADLRTRDGRELSSENYARVIKELQNRPGATLAELEHLTGLSLKAERGTISRWIPGDGTGHVMEQAVGDAWGKLDLDEQDRWILRVLRRHAGKAQESPEAWKDDDERRLRHDAEETFGEGALERIDEVAWGKDGLEDRFASISVKAARILADCHERQIDAAAQNQELRKKGAPEPILQIHDSLPYYGAVLDNQTVPAELFAPRKHICEDELEHGRARNPDIHLVLNRVRKVVNAIIDMMGGIPPSQCCVEMARSAMSEAAAEEHGIRTRQRQKAREKIVDEIQKALGEGKKLPRGPGLEKLVERWKAAMRQGWRDYDGNEIPQSELVDDGAEYQLDHVEPAAFGDQRQDNLFVTRFNHKKGKTLPWEAFGNDSQFSGALLAFAHFGAKQKIKGIKAMLQNIRDAKTRTRLQSALEEANNSLSSLADYGEPDPDVLNRLEKVPQELKNSGLEREAGARGLGRLFRKFHPEYKARGKYANGTDPDAKDFTRRDFANIGWTTKLTCQYLESLGAKVHPIRSGAVHELRCMLEVNKERSDLRNHAVDAFIVGHIDAHVFQPALERVLHSYSFERKYETGPLWDALEHLNEQKGKYGKQDLEENCSRLDELLPYVSTSHRPDHKWNPGDSVGAGLGEIGRQNLYAWRPSIDDRRKATSILTDVEEKDVVSPKKAKDILVDYEKLKSSASTDKKIQAKLKKMNGLLELTYRGKASNKGVKIDVLKRTRRGGYAETRSKFALISRFDGKRPKRSAESLVAVLQADRSERERLFADGTAVYRRGDILVEDGKAEVITGIKKNGSLRRFSVNKAGRSQEDGNFSAPGPKARKVKFDVLGRRLFALGTDTGGIQPVPYPLRD